RIVRDAVSAAQGGAAVAEDIPCKSDPWTEVLPHRTVRELRVGLEDHTFRGGWEGRRLHAGYKSDLLFRVLLPPGVDVQAQPERESQTLARFPGVLEIESGRVIAARRDAAGTLSEPHRSAEQEIRD